MRALLLPMMIAGLLAGGPAQAQEEAVVRETRCWLGSVTFSDGARMNVGDGIAVCEGDRGWVADGTEAAGCLLEGELSAVGAVVGISNNDRLSLQCEPNGRWTTLEVGAEAE